MRPLVQCLESRVLLSGYTLTQLGFLGSAGPSSSYQFVEKDFALSSSNVVGIRPRKTGTAQTPFIGPLKKFAPTYLPVSSVYLRASVNAVNGSGVAVGFGVRSDTTADKAIMWKKGKATVLGPGFANGINKSGVIVGTDDASGVPIPVIFGKHLTKIPTLGGAGGDAVAINDSGIIVGHSLIAGGNLHAFLWDQKHKPVDLSPKSSSSTAFAVNNSNVVVGVSDNLPFYYSKSKLTFLPVNKSGNLRGGSALAINDSGVIVGQDRFANPPFGTGVESAVEWVKGKEIDLNTLLPKKSGWQLSKAVSINNAGQIVAFGTGSDGFNDSVLLTPA